jgi:hypothetical protein
MTHQGNPAIDRAQVPIFTTDAARPADALRAQLHAAGRRGAAPDAAGRALLAYFRFVGIATLDARAALLEELRQEVAGTRLTPRAWLPVALGEPQFELARDATIGYLGGWPASVERRARAIEDVIDWIRRDLALNGPALFCALLCGADADLLERLAGLRGRFAPEVAQGILGHCENSSSPLLQEFAVEWRTWLPEPVSSSWPPSLREA